MALLIVAVIELLSALTAAKLLEAFRPVLTLF